jgi:hypothetical protein
MEDTIIALPFSAPLTTLFDLRYILVDCTKTSVVIPEISRCFAMSEPILNDISHRRFNLLRGSWVLVSPHRNKRPWQYVFEKE